MLAAAISDPRQVTLNWLRLCGILALSAAGVSMFFLFRRPGGAGAALWILNGAVAAAVLGQLAFVQLAWRRTQLVFAWLAFLLAVRVGADHLRMGLPNQPPLPREVLAVYASAVGVATMAGLALMDMLLGHAYLTASKMTISPFLRLNLTLAGSLVWRAIVAVGVTMLLQHYRPVYLLWGQHGLFILTRWLLGLIVPAVFIYMAHDCIKRRSTQAATGILYVAGVLIFIGEIVALHLVRSTGLPF